MASSRRPKEAEMFFRQLEAPELDTKLIRGEPRIDTPRMRTETNFCLWKSHEKKVVTINGGYPMGYVSLQERILWNGDFEDDFLFPNG